MSSRDSLLLAWGPGLGKCCLILRASVDVALSRCADKTLALASGWRLTTGKARLMSGGNPHGPAGNRTSMRSRPHFQPWFSNPTPQRAWSRSPFFCPTQLCSPMGGHPPLPRGLAQSALQASCSPSAHCRAQNSAIPSFHNDSLLPWPPPRLQTPGTSRGALHTIGQGQLTGVSWPDAETPPFYLRNPSSDWRAHHEPPSWPPSPLLYPSLQNRDLNRKLSLSLVCPSAPTLSCKLLAPRALVRSPVTSML